MLNSKDIMQELQKHKTIKAEAEALEALKTMFPIFLKNAGYREKNILQNLEEYHIRKDGSRQEYTIISFTDTAGCTCEYCLEKEAFTN